MLPGNWSSNICFPIRFLDIRISMSRASDAPYTYISCLTNDELGNVETRILYCARLKSGNA